MACFSADCPRCVVRASRLCCDTCNPESFTLPTPTTSAPKKTRAPNRFKVGEHVFTDVDDRLKTALQEWRSNQIGDDEMFGPQLIMTDDVLDRLVGLAHFGKVSDLASIHTQVSWRHIDIWGADILNIIKKYFPDVEPIVEPDSPRPVLQASENLPGPSSRPSNTLSTAPSGSRVSKSTRKRRCSACGSEGHIGMSYRVNILRVIYDRYTASNRTCPYHKSLTGITQDPNENVFMVSDPLNPQPRSHVPLLQQAVQFS